MFYTANRIGIAYVHFPATWGYVYEPYAVIRTWNEGKPAIAYKCYKHFISSTKKIESTELISVMDDFFDAEFYGFTKTTMDKINILYGTRT